MQVPHVLSTGFCAQPSKPLSKDVPAYAESPYPEHFTGETALSFTSLDRTERVETERARAYTECDSYGEFVRDKWAPGGVAVMATFPNDLLQGTENARSVANYNSAPFLSACADAMRLDPDGAVGVLLAKDCEPEEHTWLQAIFCLLTRPHARFVDVATLDTKRTVRRLKRHDAQLREVLAVCAPLVFAWGRRMYLFSQFEAAPASMREQIVEEASRLKTAAASNADKLKKAARTYRLCNLAKAQPF